MGEYALKVTYNEEIRVHTVPGEQNLLVELRALGYSEISAPCGGNGTCKRCTIIISGKAIKIGEAESKSFLNAEIPSCRYTAAGDLEIIIPKFEKMEIMTNGAANIAGGGEGLGVAVDIGTTTVAAFLYDLATGERLAVESGRNAQRAYGADVISRIQFCAGDGGLERLKGVIRAQLDAAIDALCARTGRARADITIVSIAGNTVMQHIFQGLSPVKIGVSPFTPESWFGEIYDASEFFGGLHNNAILYQCPALAGYVGGDITAGLYSSGAWLETGDCLFIDIGTNGEMGLGNSGSFVTCATAAGPAFEGAEIECGMDGSVGAISAAAFENGKITFEVIGGGEPAGICGSGLIDALAALLKSGVVLESGRMVSPEDAPHGMESAVRRMEDGKLRYYFTEKVYISAEDVRQLQLAKAAIRAGIETLMEQRGKTYDEVGSVMIAGGFGAFMNVRSAGVIGLLPPKLLDKTSHVGNTAGAGAALALVERARAELRELTDRCDYLELSSSALFMDKYIECMLFDEVEDVE